MMPFRKIMLLRQAGLGRFLVGLPAAYAHAPGCDPDRPDADSACGAETLTVTRKWQERTGRTSFDNHLELRAADGVTYNTQVRDNEFWTRLGETRPVTAQVWRQDGGSRVMWLRGGSADGSPPRLP